jgi:hypothetical protein
MTAGEVIIFRDAEATATSYLLEEFAARDWVAGLTATSAIPNPRPARYLQVIRTGGFIHDMVWDRPQLLIIAASDDEGDAIDILNLVRGLMVAAGIVGEMGEATVSEVNEFSGPANWPDPNSGQPRYRCTFELDLRGSAV